MAPTYSASYPVSFCQGRKGQVYVFQGHGASGKVYGASAAWRDVGLAAPVLAASLAAHGDIRYYVARCDIVEAGNGFTEPPTVTLNSTAAPTTAAKALARLRGDGLLELYMQNYGKGYADVPTVSLTEPLGMPTSNAELEVSITGSQNNWNPGTGDIIVVDADAAGYTLTGLVAGSAGQVKRIRIVGDYGISIALASGSSSAGNRFSSNLFSGTRTVQPNRTLHFVYQSSAWHLIRATNDVSDEGASGAAAVAIAVPHLRGKYQCYYRYLDPTVTTAEGGPLYSNLSPVYELDVPLGTKQATWTYTVPTSGLHVELWRTTSNQSTTLFRVALITSPTGSYVDDLTDWELTDTKRAADAYRAMPILLPNGELNANRFGVPPTNYSAAIFFQDRLWMGVDTGGTNPNTLRFSEHDEPESMPDVNELIVQSNLRATDYITALIPYAGVMLVMQSKHCHRLMYVSQPLLDAGISLMAYRGCLNQRCWDIFDGRVYAMDDLGLYSLDPQGRVEDLTLGIYDVWRDKIDFEKAKWFTVRADKRNALLRVSVTYKEDANATYPSRMLVYSFDAKTWWEERYPDELTCATEMRLDDKQTALVYGTSSGNLRLLWSGDTDISVDSVNEITITGQGLGYRKPPAITTATGHGAEFEAGIDDQGRVVSIRKKFPGTQCTAGSLTIEAPPTNGTQATATFTVHSTTVPVPWAYKSGCYEFTTDAQRKDGERVESRNVSVTYKPTAASTILYLQPYYNNAAYPRRNSAACDRGSGFYQSDVYPASMLDMIANPQQEIEAHGVASAMFSGKTLADMMGSDRHVSLALSGETSSAGAVVIHIVDIEGVNGKGG